MTTTPPRLITQIASVPALPDGAMAVRCDAAAGGYLWSQHQAGALTRPWTTDLPHLANVALYTVDDTPYLFPFPVSINSRRLDLAPQDATQVLRNIQDTTLFYSWEERVGVFPARHNEAAFFGAAHVIIQSYAEELAQVFRCPTNVEWNIECPCARDFKLTPPSLFGSAYTNESGFSQEQEDAVEDIYAKMERLFGQYLTHIGWTNDDSFALLTQTWSRISNESFLNSVRITPKTCNPTFAFDAQGSAHARLQTAAAVDALFSSPR